ncbi:hypothetical protein ACN28I_16650 [Archangium gephyra]|uniref:hypothetical protein n=1 Tax=Archangium gephyra TaxID=48 RepID=UPI003B7C6335
MDTLHLFCRDLSTAHPRRQTGGRRTRYHICAAPLHRSTEWIRSNPLLKDLDGLNVTSVKGSLAIYNNAGLASLGALRNLTSIGGGLQITNNPSLTSPQGLEGVRSVGDSIQIAFNDSLRSVEGLQNLTAVNNLDIWRNQVLTGLGGLRGLTSVRGQLSLFGNQELKGLEGLEQVQSLGSLRIEQTALESLDGFRALGDIQNPMTIRDNASLAECLVNEFVARFPRGCSSCTRNMGSDTSCGAYRLKLPHGGGFEKSAFEKHPNYEQYKPYYYLAPDDNYYYLRSHFQREFKHYTPYEIPILSSYPQGKSVLYLDWDGEDLAPMHYDFCGEPQGSRVCKAPFGDTLEPEEEKVLRDASTLVGYMFSPFNINVTTSLDEFLAVPEVNRGIAIQSRVLHTPAGGVAGHFFGQDGNTAVVTVRHQTTHEYGHTFGVGHTYVTSQPTRMKELPQWSSVHDPFHSGVIQWTKGEYRNSHYESILMDGVPLVDGGSDALRKIAEHVGYRPDDHSNYRQRATPLGPDQSVRGIIGRNTDIDWFKLMPDAGSALSIQVSATFVTYVSYKVSSLDVGVKLYDSNDALVAESDPADSIDARIDVPADTLSHFSPPFFLVVDGVGLGEPLAPENAWGYTDYGSMGPYEVRASFQGEQNSQTINGLTAQLFDQYIESEDDFDLARPESIQTVRGFGAVPLKPAADDFSVRAAGFIEIPPLPRGRELAFDYTFEVRTDHDSIGRMTLFDQSGNKLLEVDGRTRVHPERCCRCDEPA